jgi:hypothetical protein
MVNNCKILSILALIGFSGAVNGMSYQNFNGDVSEEDALAIALSDSEQEHKDEAAKKIQALYRGWFQRERALRGKIQVNVCFRTMHPNGTYTTRRIPTEEALAVFEGKTIPMNQLQKARELFIRLRMVPFAYTASLEKARDQGRKIQDDLDGKKGSSSLPGVSKTWQK